MRLMTIAAGLVLIALTACSDRSRQADLEAGVRFAKTTLELAKTDPQAQDALRAALENDGTPVSYLAASLPANAKFSSYEWQRPSRAWTVVVKDGPGNNELTIEGYGKDLGTPLYADQVSFPSGLPRPGGTENQSAEPADTEPAAPAAEESSPAPADASTPQPGTPAETTAPGGSAAPPPQPRGPWRYRAPQGPRPKYEDS